MKIVVEMKLRDFYLKNVTEDMGSSLTPEEVDVIERWLDFHFPDGVDESELIDLFWFQKDFVQEILEDRSLDGLFGNGKLAR